MWGELFKWLDVHYHGFAVLFAGMGIAFAIASLYNKWGNRVRKTEGKCEVMEGKIEANILPKLSSADTAILLLTNKAGWLDDKINLVNNKVDRLADKLDRVADRIDELSFQFGRLSDQFGRLIVHLKTKDSTIDVSLFFTKSPIRLTDSGERVLIATGGKIFVDDHLQGLIEEMDRQHIKTALDAQQCASKTILGFSDLDSFKEIKDYIFMNPRYKERNSEGAEVSTPLNLAIVCDTMGIYLRDKYLEKYPHLNPGTPPLSPSFNRF